MKKIILLLIVFLFSFISNSVYAEYMILGPDGKYHYPDVGALNVTLVSYNGGDLLGKNSSSSAIGDFTGHSFLEFENIYDKDIYIGPYLLKIGEKVTVGLYPDYKITFNLEGYNAKGKYSSNCATITMQVLSRDLSSVNEYISPKYNIYSLKDFNCSHYATSFWNWLSYDNFSNKTKYVSFIVTGIPNKLYEDILTHSMSKKGYQYLNNDKFFKYNNDNTLTEYV